VTITTERLTIRRLEESDAPFILTLLNDESFIKYIGDKGVRSLDGARQYLATGPLASYAQHGYGLNAVTLAGEGSAIGICGVLRRDSLDAPDLGFAFLPAYRGKGYAFEAASAVMADARTTHGLSRLLAITQPDNEASIALLGRLGFRFEGLMRMAGSDRPTRLFAWP
jgi:RimJ/RimL family protein N-acetyltransferase